MSIRPVCHECYSSDIKIECFGCYNVFYCGFECQELDWESHQQFCDRKEAPELAAARRQKCLDVISQEALFHYLAYDCFHRILKKRGFLLVDASAKYHLMSECLTLIQQISPLTLKTYRELKEEVKKEEASVSKHKGIVTLHVADESRVYIVGSTKATQLWKMMDHSPKVVLQLHRL